MGSVNCLLFLMKQGQSRQRYAFAVYKEIRQKGRLLSAQHPDQVGFCNRCWNKDRYLSTKRSNGQKKSTLPERGQVTVCTCGCSSLRFHRMSTLPQNNHQITVVKLERSRKSAQSNGAENIPTIFCPHQKKLSPEDELETNQGVASKATYSPLQHYLNSQELRDQAICTPSNSLSRKQRLKVC